MKMLPDFLRLLSGRRAGFLIQCVLGGLLGGYLVSMVLIGRQEPEFVSTARLALHSPLPGEGRDWLKWQAAEMLSERSLMAAARESGMDKRLELPAEECAERLSELVEVRVGPDDFRSWSDRSNLPEPRDVVYLSARGGDGWEAAWVLKVLIEGSRERLERLNAARLASSPQHAEWLALSARLPGLMARAGRSEMELRRAMQGVTGRPVALPREALVASNPPELGRAAHGELQAALQELEETREAMARAQASGGYSFALLEAPVAMSEPRAPDWHVFAWKRALAGGGLMLLAGALWLWWRGRSPSEEVPVMGPARMVEY